MTGTSVATPAVGARTAARATRLRGSREVRAVFASGVAVGSGMAVVHVRRREKPGLPRVTVVAGRKVGSAVDRNRVKRRLRAIVTDLELEANTDYVVVGRRAALHADAAKLRATVARQLAAAGNAR